MKIGPPQVPTSASPAKIQSEDAAAPPSSTPASPAPAGPVPVPYPTTGDLFERVNANPLGALLGGAATKVAGVAAEALPAAQQELAKQVGGLIASGDAENAMVGWVRGIGQHGSSNVSELLVTVMKESIQDINEDKKHLLGQLAGGGQTTGPLASLQNQLGSPGLPPTADALQGAAAGFDPNALVQHVLRGSYLESSADLKMFAGQVQSLNDAKKEIREAVTTVREATQSAGHVGDDAQLANVDLQNVLQKQQQTQQMMSNIAKMLHDTAMSVARKIGG